MASQRDVHRRPRPCPELVGRARELAAVLAPVEAPTPGGVVVVRGEAGIGKSRLLRAATSRAGERGATVLLGRATPDGTSSAFRPLVEAVATACRRRGPPTDPALAPYRPALAGLVPELAPPDGRAGGSPPLSVPVVAEGVLRLLSALAAPPVVLVVEDLHWADPETVAVLGYLADHAPESHAVVLASTRPDAGPGPDLVDRLEARRVADVVELGPLDDAGVRAMAARCLDADVLPPGLDALLDRSDGVPFHVEELLVAAARDGALVDEDGWTVRPDVEAVVPATFARSVRRRWGCLARGDRDVLGVAALLGRRVDPGLVAAALAVPVAAVSAALEAGTEQGILDVDRAGHSFRHALTRDAVLERLAVPTRSDLAARSHAALVRHRPALDGPWCRTAAELAVAAGDPVQGARHWVEVARRARDGGALTTARAAARRAAGAAAADPALALEVAELSTGIEAAAGDVDGALAAAAAAAPGHPERALVLQLLLADAEIAATRWEDAATRLLRVRGTATEPGSLARADAMLAQVRLGQADVAQAESLARGVLERAGQDDPESTCRALEVLGRAARQRDLAAAVALFARQERVADEAGLRLWALRATHELGGIDLMRSNDPARLEEARDRAVRAGAAGVAATVELQLAASGWVAYDPERILAHTARCLAWVRLGGAGSLLEAEALLLDAGAHAVAGRRGAMESALARVLDLGRPEADLAAGVHVRRGTYRLFRDDVAGAAAEHDAAAAMMRESPAVYLRPWWRTWALLQTVLDRDGDAARAEAWSVVQPDSPMATAWLHYADAVAHGRAGRRRRAAELAGLARSRLAAPGLTASRHVAERLVAPCALADGWGDPGAWMVEAASFFHRAGHADLERGCRSLARRAGARLPRREHGHREVDAGLADLGVTDREAEVLGLVARGLTNREVAQRLQLSVRTVDKHVEHLLTKTGRRRRTELRGLVT